MVRRLTAIAVGAGVILTAPRAGAQAHSTFGERGEIILSADRLFPLFAYSHTSQDDLLPVGSPKETSTNNEASISLLWGSTQPVGENFYTVPRVGFDYVLFPHVTVGGDLIVFFTLGGSSSASTTNAGVTTTNSNGNPSSLVFGLAPRGGYILPLSDLFSLWLRGGFSYYVGSTKTTTGAGAGQTTNSGSVNQFGLDLDPQIVFTPIPHLGVTAGLTADIPLTGGHSSDTDQGGVSTSQSAWSSIFFFGITTGLIGYF